MPPHLHLTFTQVRDWLMATSFQISLFSVDLSAAKAKALSIKAAD